MNCRTHGLVSGLCDSYLKQKSDLQCTIASTPAVAMRRLEIIFDTVCTPKRSLVPQKMLSNKLTKMCGY